MHIDVSTKKYKGKVYYAIRVVETKYFDGRRINKILKTIGNTTDVNEVEKMRRKAWSYILETQKDIKVSLSEIKRIRSKSPVGLMKMVERILSNLDLIKKLKKTFGDSYDELIEEIVYRFYSVTSERALYLTTEKPKDRYYRLLDKIFKKKRGLENLFYNALERKGKIMKHEVKIDTTSTYFEGNGLSIAMYGYSRDHRGDRKQIVILLVLIDDYPLFSYVFEGNKKDVSLFLQTVKDLKKRIKYDRFIIFCDRGFFKSEYLKELEKEGIFYVMAVPRRIGEWPEYHNNKSKEFFVDGRRAVLYENPELRKTLLKELEETLRKIKDDLNKLTPSEIERKYKYALKFINIKKKTLKEKMVEKEKKVLGRWIVVTNISDKPAEGIVEDYKSLQEIERDFRILKHELNLRPVFHRRDDRVISHIFICVLILLIKHVIEEEFGKEKLEEIMKIFSYDITTEKGILSWAEKISY